MKDIHLKLKSYGCYMITNQGCHFYTERGFTIFIPNEIMKKVGDLSGKNI